jgi:cell wall-associated NlpC family hydrolase
MDYISSRLSYSHVAGEEEYVLCLADVGNWHLGGTTTEYMQIIAELGFKIESPEIKVLLNSAICFGKYQRGATPLLAPAVVDCSSLVQWLYSRLGVNLPRYAIEQRKWGWDVTHQCLKEGDLVFAKGKISRYDDNPDDAVGHVGIVTDIGTVIHAKNSEHGVIEDTFAGFCPQSDDFRGARRILPDCEWYTIKIPTATGIQFSSDLKWKVAEKLKR